MRILSRRWVPWLGDVLGEQVISIIIQFNGGYLLFGIFFEVTPFSNNF
jgi:hypothetical protein